MAIRHPKNLQLERRQYTPGRALSPPPAAQKRVWCSFSTHWCPACLPTTGLQLQQGPLTRKWILQGEAKPSWSGQGLRAQGECLWQRQQSVHNPLAGQQLPSCLYILDSEKCSSNLPRCFFSFKLATDDFYYFQSSSQSDYICRTEDFNV